MTRQGLVVHSVSSGSSGNAVLVAAGETCLLLDCGVPVRRLTGALRRLGRSLDNLTAILVTHEHVDHCSSAIEVARRSAASIAATSGTLRATTAAGTLSSGFQGSRDGDAALPAVVALNPQEWTPVGRAAVCCFPVSHDASEPVGFEIEIEGKRIVYATDVGQVDQVLESAVLGADLAILEANHDLRMLSRSPYPVSTRERIASSRGHLSNSACAELIGRRLKDPRPLSVWLAHLSRVNNTPALARRAVMEAAAGSTTLAALEVALRDQPSATWRPGQRAVQLSLAWSPEP